MYIAAIAGIIIVILTSMIIISKSRVLTTLGTYLEKYVCHISYACVIYAAVNQIFRKWKLFSASSLYVDIDDFDYLLYQQLCTVDFREKRVYENSYDIIYLTIHLHFIKLIYAMK